MTSAWWGLLAKAKLTSVPSFSPEFEPLVTRSRHKAKMAIMANAELCEQIDITWKPSRMRSLAELNAQNVCLSLIHGTKRKPEEVDRWVPSLFGGLQG